MYSQSLAVNRNFISFSLSFFKFSPKDMIIDLRERDREKETSIGYLLNQPGAGMKPTT